MYFFSSSDGTEKLGNLGQFLRYSLPGECQVSEVGLRLADEGVS
jgi:hypothetical protein